MALVADDRIATLVAGALTLAAGAVLVAIAPRSPLHRAAGLFFGVRGANLSLVAFADPYDDLQGRLVVYFLLATPFAAAWMAYRLLQDGGGPRRLPPGVARATGAFLAAGAAVLGLVYARDHLVFFDGPLVYVFHLQFVVYAAIAAAIGLAMRTAPDGPARRALFTFMLGFLGEPLYYASDLLLQRLRGIPFTGLETAFALAALAIGLAALPAAGLRRGRKEVGPAVVLALVALMAAGLRNLQGEYAFAPRHLLGLPELNAAWTLWTIAATMYASLRYRLFVMDLRVKQFLRYGATTFLVGFLFFVASEVLESMLDAGTLLQSLLAAAIIGIALYPLHRLTQRVAERLMPGVADTDDYRARRRREIYWAAVERARSDGTVDEAERDALRILGTRLGLSGREMAQLETGPA